MNDNMTMSYEKMRLENMKHFGFGPEVMKTLKVCRECGAKVDSKLQICPKCDYPLPSESLYMMYVRNHFICSGCKTVVMAEYRFCPHCGKKLIFE